MQTSNLDHHLIISCTSLLYVSDWIMWHNCSHVTANNPQKIHKKPKKQKHTRTTCHPQHKIARLLSLCFRWWCHHRSLQSLFSMLTSAAQPLWTSSSNAGASSYSAESGLSWNKIHPRLWWRKSVSSSYPRLPQGNPPKKHKQDG